MPWNISFISTVRLTVKEKNNGLILRTIVRLTNTLIRRSVSTLLQVLAASDGKVRGACCSASFIGVCRTLCNLQGLFSEIDNLCRMNHMGLIGTRVVSMMITLCYH